MSPKPALTVNQTCPEQPLVRRSFGRAAGGYDGVAQLQRQVGLNLLAKLPQMAQLPGMVIDVGTGTGFCAEHLLARFPNAPLIALDIAEGMLNRTRLRLRSAHGERWLLCADAEALPLASRSVDLVFSNLVLQWCRDLPSVLGEFRRVLRPGGVLALSSFGPQTLRELRAAWAKVDSYAHVNHFHSENFHQNAAIECGFHLIEMSSTVLSPIYPTLDDLMRELKNLGAHNVTLGRSRGLTGKGSLRQLREHYRALMTDDQIHASFEVIHLVARVT